MDLKIQQKWCLVIVYGAAQDDEKDDFLSDLSDICRDQSLPLLIGGDFNLLRGSNEKNKALKPSRWNDMFNYIINTYELREIDMSGGQFTWSNNQAVPTLEKLDRFLASKEWELLFPLTTVHKLSREISNHSPIILDTMEGRENQNKEFRFDNRWLKEENFLPKVYRIWSQLVRARDSLSCFQQKLKNLMKFLKGWGANIRGRDIKKKKELTQELVDLEVAEEIMNLSFEQAKRKCIVQEELLLIYEKEEDF
jgi:hypothetical protein